MNLRVLCSAALVLVTSPAVARVATFDVFGIQIGDTPAIVTDALTAKGFAKYREHRGPTFDEQVAIRRKKIDAFTAKGALKEIIYTRDADDITVIFTAWPDGEKVTQVFYHPNITPEDCPSFKDAAEQKYGKGIKYAGAWIDRPVEKKKGFGERKSDETISVMVKCSLGDRLIDMGLFGAPMMLNRMLDKADGEVKHDF